jgi:hypothetical protein
MRIPFRLIVAELFMSHASSFSVIDNFHLMQTAASSMAHQLTHADILGAYTQTLEKYPLPTQMTTGATLAVTGDAIAQSKYPTSPEYDRKRAASFAVFDMSYRVLQHFAFPLMVANLHGQYLGSFPLLHDNFDDFFRSTMERTLANQLGIVPFLYYPAFFALTGAVQGLSVSSTITRAQETFLFLLSRNLLFWVPVQFFQFGFVEEELQIPFVCVAGLVWTVILSILAGSTKGYISSPEEEVAEAMEEMLALDVESTPVGGNFTLVSI